MLFFLFISCLIVQIKSNDGTIYGIELYAQNITSPIKYLYRNNYCSIAHVGNDVIVWKFETDGELAFKHTIATGENVRVFGNDAAFAVLLENGKVVTFGSQKNGFFESGGDSSKVSDQLMGGVKDIYSNDASFTALKHDGTVVCWGSEQYGGDCSQYKGKKFKQVYRMWSAYIGIMLDGSVRWWGRFEQDDGSSTKEKDVSADLSSGVERVFAFEFVFVALKSDSSLITWGEKWRGGDSSKVRAHLSSGVTATIVSNGHAMMALKDDATVVSWGQPGYGGDISAIQQMLVNVKSIYSYDSGFAVLRRDHKFIFWGYKISYKTVEDVNKVYINGGSFALMLRSKDKVIRFRIRSDGRMTGIFHCPISDVEDILPYNDNQVVSRKNGELKILSYGYGKSHEPFHWFANRPITKFFNNYSIFAMQTKDTNEVLIWQLYGGNSIEVNILKHCTSCNVESIPGDYAFRLTPLPVGAKSPISRRIKYEPSIGGTVIGTLVLLGMLITVFFLYFVRKPIECSTITKHPIARALRDKFIVCLVNCKTLLNRWLKPKNESV